jgi:hypothetical protein
VGTRLPLGRRAPPPSFPANPYSIWPMIFATCAWMGVRDARAMFKFLVAATGSIVEIRALGVDRVRASGIVSGYFSDEDKFVAAAEHLDGCADGVFVTLNPVRVELLARANIRSPDLKRGAVLAAVKLVRPEDAQLVEDWFDVFDRYRRQRDKIAHHLWIKDGKKPSRLILVPPAAFASWVQVLRRVRRGTTPPTTAKWQTQNADMLLHAQVYEQEELQKLLNDLQTLYPLARDLEFLFHGHVEFFGENAALPAQARERLSTALSTWQTPQSPSPQMRRRRPP